MPSTPERPRRVSIDRDGPALVEGPVTVVGEDGVAVTSHRFVVAVCTCRRSRTYPWCDTSHRRRSRPGHDADGAAGDGGGDGAARAHDEEQDGRCGPGADTADGPDTENSPDAPDGEAR